MSDYQIEVKLTGKSPYTGRQGTINKSVVFTTGVDPHYTDEKAALTAYKRILRLLSHERREWDPVGAARIEALLTELEDQG